MTSKEGSQGRPKFRPDSGTFKTKGGITVKRQVIDLGAEEGKKAFEDLSLGLDSGHGCLFQSAYEYPGRYARWSMGFKAPPIMIEGYQGTSSAKIYALNERGRTILTFMFDFLKGYSALKSIEKEEDLIRVEILRTDDVFTEEERSKKNSLFSLVRGIIDAFQVNVDEDPQLGLYGAFGYNLTFQFEDIELHQKRSPTDRDIVLYLPDEILVTDIQLCKTWRLQYDFEIGNQSTEGIPRTAVDTNIKCNDQDVKEGSDFQPGEYAERVKLAKEEFKKGNLFEAVLSQTFRTSLKESKLKPHELFDLLRIRNPSPYLFQINLGENEHLVGASPEMFVRADKILNDTKDGYDIRIETCPISGTIKRGANALEDAEQIKQILADKKEESEITMCTDVDRNDKSRICKSGSVRVVGRRQIEKYSKLIHTVDHVIGILRPGFDALDAFLVHTWAVTVTGAPKRWAIQFVEKTEKSDRKWYAGAVGMLGFDGTMNTGLTLRTIRIKGEMAEIRAGATLLYDSDPVSEEKETELKASAFREILRKGTQLSKSNCIPTSAPINTGFKVLMIDHDDSFVNTLSNYIRELGVEVITVRYSKVNKDVLAKLCPDLAVMSPGPGNPRDFDCSGTLSLLLEQKIPIFGVCLGLQAIVEHFGGELGILDYPVHGKPTRIKRAENTESIFATLPSSFVVGRYHSLYAIEAQFPECLECLAKTIPESLGIEGVTEPPVIMGIRHRTLPIAAVQFHPESILTNPRLGLQILRNAIEDLVWK